MTVKHSKSGSSAPAQTRKTPEAHKKLAAPHAALALEDQVIEDGIVDMLSGLTTIETDITSLARKTVSDTLRTGGLAAGELVGIVNHVVLGTVSAAEQVGTGLTLSIKGVAKGIVMGVHDVNGDVIDASAETIRSVIHHGAAVGADVGLIARHAVDGVIEAVAEMGGDVAHVAKKAIESAIEEAGNIGKLAIRTVKDVLTGVVSETDLEIGAMAHAAEGKALAARQTHRHHS
ncbi:MAG TPA: hypothetical protein VF472_13365 [Burkholderiaceae bacterium]